MQKSIYPKVGPHKRKLVTYSGVNFGTNGVGIDVPLFRLTQGDGTNERKGLDVRFKRIIVSGILFLSTGTEDNIHARVMCVLNNQLDTSQFGYANYVEYPVGGDVSTKIHYTLKESRFNNLDILYDRFFRLSSKHSFEIEVEAETITVAAGAVVHYRFSIPLNTKVRYNSSGSLPKNKNLNLFFHADRDLLLVNPTEQKCATTGTVELHFEDL